MPDRSLCRALALVLALLFTLPASGRESVGLVLAGGGARGIAHAGVIAALEEMRIPIDAVAGTSMGALVGGLYAAGQDSQQLYEIVQSIDWEAAFQDSVDRNDLPQRRKSDDYDYATDFSLTFRDGQLTVPLGLIQGQQVRQMIKELMRNVAHIRDFDQLPTPYRAVATDIETGDAYIFEDGNIVTAMRASMSLPALLAPVEHDDRLLVDGGLAMNIPVEVGQSMGVDRLIVVDIGTPLMSRDEITSVLGVTDQVFGFLTRKNSIEQLELMTADDVLIRPELEGRGMLAFDLYEEIYQLGYEATMAMATELAPFSIDQEQWESYLAWRAEPYTFDSTIDFIDVKNNSPVGDAVILARLNQTLGEPLDREQLQDDIASIYALDYWEIIDYELLDDSRGSGLLINAQAQNLGNHKLKLGLNLTTDLDGSSELNAGGSYLLKGVNELGGEVYARGQIGENSLLSGEFFQPLDVYSRFFLVPRLSYEDRKINTLGPEFDLTRVIGSWRVREAVADLGAGANIGNRTQVRAGAFRGLGEFEASSNSSDLLPDGDFDTGAAYLSLRYDSLDDPFFATQGLLLYGDYQWHRDSLGSDFDFDRFEFMGQGAISFGEDKANNLVFTARATVLDDAPRAPQYFSRLGGLFNLSGISQDLLAGRQLAFLMAQYQRKLTRSGVLPIDVPVYAGFSVEGGNLWQDRSDMDLGDLVMAGSIYLAVNSPLGPVYIAYGRNEEELDAIYLSIGWPFLQPSGRLIR